MKVLRNILLILAGLTLLSAVLMAVWMTWFFDLNTYRDDIKTALEKSTGLEVEFGEEIEHYLLENLHVSVRDIQLKAQGKPLALVDRLQLQISLYALLTRTLQIDELRLDVSRLNLIRSPQGWFDSLRPKSSDKSSSDHSAATGSAGWFDTVRIGTLDIKLTKPRLRDPGQGLELSAQQAELQLHRLPVMENADLLLDDPSWVMGYSQHVSFQGRNIILNDLRLAELELSLDNRKGRIEIGRLIANMDRGKPGDPDHLSLGIDGRGSLSLGFDEPPSELPQTDWKAIDQMELSGVEVNFAQLHAGSGETRLELENTHLKIERLPVLQHGNIWTMSLDNLLAMPNLAFQHKGGGLWLGKLQLKPFDLILRTSNNGLEIQSRQTGISLHLDGEDIKQFSTTLSGKLMLSAGKGKPVQSAPSHLRLQSLDVQALNGSLDTSNGNYRFKEMLMRAADIPLISDGQMVNWDAPRVLARDAPGLSIELDVNGMRHGDESIESANLSLVRRGDRLELTQLKAQLENTHLSGSGEIELELTPPHWHVKMHSPRIALSPLLIFFNSQYQAEGNLSLDLDISGIGLQNDDLPPSLNGSLLMTGENILIENFDLDAIIDQLEKTRSVGLLDLGAYALAGPAGTLLTKGQAYANLQGIINMKGTTRVSAMRSELAIDSGVLNTRDVAIRTAGHRLAVKGSLDLKADAPLALEIATLNAQGCALYMERIQGNLNEPRVSQAGVVIKGVIKPITSVLGGLTDLVASDSCKEAFYTGKVAHNAVSQ